MTNEQRDIIRSDQQYTPIAHSYKTSRIHSQGTDLPRMLELANLQPGAALLDVGTGVGHTALAFSSAGARAVGLDLTPAMLVQAQHLAAERELGFEAVCGVAESLPFADATFDGISCRYCAHHFIDVQQALAEMRRVLKPGSAAVFVDLVAPEDDEADEFVNHLEWLRDQSHRREPRRSEYEQWFDDARLRIDHIDSFTEVIVLDQWFERARTSSGNEREARAMLTGASAQLRETFAIATNPASFDLHVILVKATAL